MEPVTHSNKVTLMDSQLRHRNLSANGQRIHAVEAGTGPLVLLVHGFPETWYSWRHQLTALSEAGYRAVAIDQRGYGRSSKPQQIHDYRITELVADLLGVVEALGENTATIVGHDWGAPPAWTAAWTHPEVFTAVVGVSVAFGGRSIPLPGNPFGEHRPSQTSRQIAGDDQIFCHEYFSTPGLVEQETLHDIRGWLEGLLYSMSALPAPPPELAALDPSTMSDPELVQLVRASPMCLRPGAQLRDSMAAPPAGALAALWSADDLDHYIDTFERSGFTEPLHYYRCMDLNWELLAGYQDRPLEVPALFIGGDRDVATLWSQSAIHGFSARAPQARPPIVLANCGHWVQQEHPKAFNAALLDFLSLQ
jgi:pimeloyl-ACP methyl ester carboxylesterase